MIRYVRQRYDHDCLVAVIAMLLDVPYGEALALLGFPPGINPGQHAPLSGRLLEQVLARSGIMWQAGTARDFLERPADWPETRYERKARRQGREVWYFRYRRV